MSRRSANRRGAAASSAGSANGKHMGWWGPPRRIPAAGAGATRWGSAGRGGARPRGRGDTLRQSKVGSRSAAPALLASLAAFTPLLSRPFPHPLFFTTLLSSNSPSHLTPPARVA